MPKIFIAIVCSLVIIGLTGCGGQVESEGGPESSPVATTGTPEIVESPAPPPRPTPTLRPTPAPTPLPATAPVSGSAVEPGFEGQDGQGDGQQPEATEQAPATPEPTPVPTPTPAQFRPVQPPDLIDLPGGSGGAPIFKFASGPRMDNYRLSLSGTITDRPDLAGKRWTIQVWQSQYEVDLTANCSTEKPVAFIMAPSGSGNSFVPVSTPYEWRYCIQGQGYARSHDVPWIRASSWSIKERKRQYTTEPRIWDFAMSANLDDERVANLEYYRPAGWTILVWAGETLVAREWVGF